MNELEKVNKIIDLVKSKTSKGLTKEVLNDINQAIKLNPDSADLYNERGLINSKLRQYKKAINDFTIAIQINPELFEAYKNRGNLYSKSKKYNEG